MSANYYNQDNVFDPSRNALVNSDQFNQFSSLPISIAINNSVRRLNSIQQRTNVRAVQRSRSSVRKTSAVAVSREAQRKRRNTVDNTATPHLSQVAYDKNQSLRVTSAAPRKSLANYEVHPILIFRNGDGVWFLLPGESDSPLYYPGIVTEYHVKGNVVTIAVDQSVDSEDVKERQFTVENNGLYVKKRGLSTESPGGVMDMITMKDLTEPALLWNIRQRYKNSNIYTYVGSMLISVNPYKMYDNIYGLPVVKKYEGRVLGDLPPHLFALASASYTRMCKDSDPQVIVISGESGSGKTECTKLILGYLALVNKSPSNLITEQILEASPLLESFGNAKTLKNDNSSRFGKYLQVFFDESSSSSIITGCKITEYLLEKSRIVTQNYGERNYHVFYELLEGLSSEQKEKYGLLSADKYFYLNQGGSNTGSSKTTIPGKDDAEDFQALVSAMQILGFSTPEIDSVFRILASVLHLGNVYFHRKALKQGLEGVEIGSDAEIQWIAHLLEISADGLRKVLTTRTTETPRGEKMTTPLTIDQSLDCRDAIAKILYSNLFAWLVQRVNRIVFSNQMAEKLHNPTNRMPRTTINILDIFGFENFKENSFEQLCINYANESLHNFLTRHVFKLEQAEYSKEKIEWTPIEYEDNTAIINLLVKKPVGILHLLDDESNFPKGTDASYLEKCHYNHALNENYLRQRMSSKEFGIKHYAGNVWYNTEGFLEKNRGDFSSSQQDSALRRLLCSSKEKILSRIFIFGTNADNPQHQQQRKHRANSRHPAQNGNQRLFVTMKPRAPTVSARFTSSLNSLMESMSKCSPWFIRCIKPNNEKKPNYFDTALVVDQLRYSGILETVKIRKLGYPIRHSFSSFVSRYKCLSRSQGNSHYSGVSNRDLTRLILTSEYAATGHVDDFQIGSSKVFLREILEQKLEKARYDLLNRAAKMIQAVVRGHVAQKRFRSQKAAAIRIQSYYRMCRARRDFIKIRRGISRLQATVRMRRDVKRYRAVREEILKRNQKRKLLDQQTTQNARNNNYGLTGVNHLEIPAELAFILSRMDDSRWDLRHTAVLRKIQQSTEISSTSWNSCLEKYIKIPGRLPFQKGNELLKMRREPIVSPFLKHSPKEEALMLFKLILRYMNDVNLTGGRELLLQNYIVNKGMRDESVRDELLVQILNQTKQNPNRTNCERGWMLLASCLSSFQPRDENLLAYLLQFCSDHAEQDESFEKTYKSICQLKLLQICEENKRGRVRLLPPFGTTELRTLDRKTLGQVFLEVEGIYERVESWMEVGEIAQRIGSKKYGKFGKNYEGCWTLDYLTEDGECDLRYEVDPNTFIFDTNFESIDYSQFGKVFGVHPESKLPPSLLFVKLLYGHPEASAHHETPISVLSSHSRLNERYFKTDEGGRGNNRAKSLDNLLDEAPIMEPSAALRRKMMGLSDSKLNQRYNNSVDNLSHARNTEPYFDDYVDEEDELGQFNSDEEYDTELIKSVKTPQNGNGGNRAGPPRYIKAISGSRKPPSSVGSKGYYAKSSAMSDTSEAPSLASHVRRVRVPSQASDVDQFLDDLFSPVLEGSNLMDDLSDVRSLVSNLKGGVYEEGQPGFSAGFKKPSGNPAAFIQSAMEQNIQIQQQLIEQNQALQELLRRSSVDNNMSPIAQNLKNMTNGSGEIPVPPPLPPQLLGEANGHRPFMDPYGRAKTVRIGKWRWPPKEDDTPSDEFTEFKARLEERRKLDQDDHLDENYHPKQKGHDNVDHKHRGKAAGPNIIPVTRNPFGDVTVGKLKLSQEMRAKLEQVTSLRVAGGTKKSPGLNPSHFENEPPKKLDESRRNVLQEKLRGAVSQNNVPPPPPPPPHHPAIMKAEVIHHMEQHQKIPVDENYDTLSQVYNQVTSPKPMFTKTNGFINENYIPERIIEPPDYDYSDYECGDRAKRLKLHSNRYQNSYGCMIKKFKLRKDLVNDDELKDPDLVIFLRDQINRDLKSKHPRISEAERRQYLEIGAGSNVIEVAKGWSLYFWRFFKITHNPSSRRSEDLVQYIAVNEKGLKLIGVKQDSLQVLDFYSWSKVVSVIANRSSIAADTVTITLGNGQKLTLGCATSMNLQRTCDKFFMNEMRSAKRENHINMKAAAAPRSVLLQQQISAPVPTSDNDDNDFHEDSSNLIQMQKFSRRHAASAAVFMDQADEAPEFHSDQSYSITKSSPYSMDIMQNGETTIGHQSQEQPSLTLPPMNFDSGAPLSLSCSETDGEVGSFENDGKHSLLQFALKYFRQKDKFHPDREKDDGQSWTWREQISCVKYSPKLIQASLIPLQTEQLNRLALECYASILKYMGDFPESTLQKKSKNQESPPPAPLLTEVEAVYTLLRNCHMATTNGAIPEGHLGLADEVYCQIMKQTTNNTVQRSAQRGWRLFTILAAYFTCSDILKPYLFKYLETNAYDKRRAFHGTALVTLQNLRKTFKYGGRRNVPSVEEITAITAGRNAKRQIFRLPGGAQRVVNVKATTVVQDVLEELCVSCLNMAGSTSEERNEFSIYCIVEGDTTMPLQKEEYILDVTTELQKNQQVYYLIFCRSVWYFPMRLDSNNNEVYIDLIFNQIAPDYLEGLLLTMPGQTLDQSLVYDIARIAALLHRAADLKSAPTLKETKYLLPKPALAARDMRPAQWVSLVNKYWVEERMGDDLLRPIQAKAIVLEILQKWDLFGSSFFSVKRMADPSPPEEYILALNKNGVHFLDIITHETLNWWNYNEIISTRKVKNEDGLLYLDLKVGNLMQQRITRLQTEHAHEISRLIRQYIHIQKYSGTNSHNPNSSVSSHSPKQ